jgi:hypothetical protein
MKLLAFEKYQVYNGTTFFLNVRKKRSRWQHFEEGG